MHDAASGHKNEHDHSHAQNIFAVIPTEVKLGITDRFSGRGVRIAFLDSGFYPHPDIEKRVVEFHDIAGEERMFRSISDPAAHHWHGTQTVVSCAGDGRLSDGLFRGLAYDAELVLIKASRDGRIDDRSIFEGLEWVRAHHRRLRIKVLNISLGGDCDDSFDESRINQSTAELVRSGITITVAAGNSSERHSVPPASSPSVITVGGYSDGNLIRQKHVELYHSSYGRTADGLVKPDLLAPAMFVAAPILPGTPDYQIAETLSMLAAVPDYALLSLLEEEWQNAGLDDSVLGLSTAEARRIIDEKLAERKIVSTHYQHVDGTSFAAPVTASVVARMLEANPALSPAAVKNILTSTASKISGNPAIRQGFGMLNGVRAIELARSETHDLGMGSFRPPHVESVTIVFYYHDDDAQRVNLAGDFNNWDMEATALSRTSDGIWTAAIPCLPSGTYRYKFVVDQRRWSEDPSHGFKEPDQLGGFNSLLMIQ